MLTIQASPVAESVPYDNSISLLIAENVQAAIDELSMASSYVKFYARGTPRPAVVVGGQWILWINAGETEDDDQTELWNGVKWTIIG